VGVSDQALGPVPGTSGGERRLQIIRNQFLW